MKRIDKKGIEISHEDGIPCRTSQGFCYWDTAFANIVQQYLGRFCPDVSSFAVDAGGKPSAEFTVLFTKSIDGSEALATSVSLAEKKKLRVPESEIDAFNKALTDFHRLAEQPGLPSANKSFIENFRIPDPRVMKEAWRVTKGRNPRLLVLWGYAKKNPTTDMILPQTAVSQGWKHSGNDDRQDVIRQLHERMQPVAPKSRSWWKWLTALFPAALAAAGIWWLLSTDFSCARPTAPNSVGDKQSAYCDIHKIAYTNECPKVCSVCKTHLGVEGLPELCPNLCRVCRKEHLENGKCPACDKVVVPPPPPPPSKVCDIHKYELVDGECPKACGVCKTHLGVEWSPDLCPNICRKCCKEHLENGKCPECDKVVPPPPPPPKVCDIHKCELVGGVCPWKCTVDWCGKHRDDFNAERKDYVCPNICRKHPYEHKDRNGGCKYCQNEKGLTDGEYKVKLVSCAPPKNGRYYPVFCITGPEDTVFSVPHWYEIRSIVDGSPVESSNSVHEVQGRCGNNNVYEFAPKDGYSAQDRLFIAADVFEEHKSGAKQKVNCSMYEWTPPVMLEKPLIPAKPENGGGRGMDVNVCGIHGRAYVEIDGVLQCPERCRLCGLHLGATGICIEYCVKHDRHKKDGLCPQCQPVARKEKIWISPSGGKGLLMRTFSLFGTGFNLKKARKIEWRWQSRPADSDISWFEALYSKYNTVTFGLHDIPDEMLEYCKKHNVDQNDFIGKLVLSIHLVSVAVTIEENGRLYTLTASLEFKEKLTLEERKSVQRHISLCGERIDANGRAYGLIRVASKPFDAEAEVENWDITLDGKMLLKCYPETEINSNDKTLVRLYKDIPHDGKIRIIAKLKGIEVPVEGTVNFNANMFTSAESFDSKAGNAAIARAESVIASKSVVRVNTNGGRGTGFAVTGKDLITNAHVVGNDTEVVLVIPNLAAGAPEKINARVVSVDRKEDIAWLRVEGEKEFAKPLKLAAIGEAVIGDEVLAMGFPFDVVEDHRGNPDTKYVVGTIRHTTRNWIVHDADIHQGNSGGPLVSVFSGRVVGVNTKKHLEGKNGEQRSVKGSRGDAVPVSKIHSAFPDLQIK